MKTGFLSAVSVFLCLMIAESFCAFAQSAVDPLVINSQKIGPGGSVISQAPGELTAGGATSQNTPSGTGINYTTETIGGETVYVFEGRKYTLGSFWGVHKLSGYSPVETGTDMTSSGFAATARHTVAASSELPLGTVIVIEGVSGPCASDYNGMYVVEDRGGYYIETEQWVDIFFDTYDEAERITHYGFNYAEIFVAVPID